MSAAARKLVAVGKLKPGTAIIIDVPTRVIVEEVADNPPPRAQYRGNRKLYFRIPGGGRGMIEIGEKVEVKVTE